MSRLWPHAPYAEDQTYPYSILTVHVVTRAVTTGSIIGLGIHGARSVLSKKNKAAAAAAAAALPRNLNLLRTTGRSALVTTAFSSVALAARMYGREEIEWADRSWRLLASNGQVETDDWTYGGAAAGVVVALAAIRRGGGGGGGGLGVVRMVGAAGLGSVVGTVVYMGWRYGVHGGKRPGDEEKEDGRL